MFNLYRRISADQEIHFCIGARPQWSPTAHEVEVLTMLATGTGSINDVRDKPFFADSNVVAIGPRLSFATPRSSNAVHVCHAAGLPDVTRIEQITRYLRGYVSTEQLLARHRDMMTQEHYSFGIESFDTGILPEPVEVIDLLGQGMPALEDYNEKHGLGMDQSDLKRNYDLFVKDLRRNPTDVELFQIAQGTSEHCRHWVLKGRMVFDDVAMERTFFELIQAPLKNLGENNRTLVAFRDNAGAMRGFSTKMLLPVVPGQPSAMEYRDKLVHLTCTAETHNHPTAVSPAPGAATGIGGRQRDSQALGRGSSLGIALAGYFVGNLFIPGYTIPGEVVGRGKLSKYAQPLDILIGAIRGDSAYGNQRGEPTTGGFCRSFGQIVDGQWREPRKPILFTAGVGTVFDEHVAKRQPEVGMLVVRIGGPAYRVGVGGGSASSMSQGQNAEALDFKSVQRGDPEMANRVGRAIQKCVEMGLQNPIQSIHDQGAAGVSNVVTELIEPLGARINIRRITLGDQTMSVLEIWVAEYQEGFAVLIYAESLQVFQGVCESERVNCEVLGTIDGNGKIVVEDPDQGQTFVDLNLGQILTDLGQKTFTSTRKAMALKALDLPKVSAADAIKGVFAQLSVGSKEFKVSHCDGTVGGLVAQQQRQGIAMIPIGDVSVKALSFEGYAGEAASLGEQPVKMLISPKAGARMAIGEALTNMCGVLISDLGDIRDRTNEMWAAKMPHELPRMYDAVTAASDFMIALGIAADGGKDSLSMSMKIGDETAIAPGSLVITAYAPVPDIRRVVTPDIKRPGVSDLYLVDLGLGRNRLGGSALAQSLNQLGNECPDIDPELLKCAFRALQQAHAEGLLLAQHDRSDGGFIATVAEMCMASYCGFNVYLKSAKTVLPELFSEELGFVLEVLQSDGGRLLEICETFSVPCALIGVTRADSTCFVFAEELGDDPTNPLAVFEGSITQLRVWWEETSFRLGLYQTNAACAEEEHRGHSVLLPGPDASQVHKLTFEPKATTPTIRHANEKPRVAILRQEGTNGDDEMQGACKAAGLAPWDVAMSDISQGKIDLTSFRGVIFTGGFANMDVFGSGVGWAAEILFNPRIREMFDQFYERPDTFSLGVCNGSQVMPLLGWVPFKELARERQPRFVGNASGVDTEHGRFEARRVWVEVLPSPSILFAGMAGSRLPIWSEHAEGQLHFPDSSVEQEVRDQGLVPLAFVDPRGDKTEVYPHNPNGSRGGATALCSRNGRHTAMMPHLERSFLSWQCGWKPAAWQSLEASPWLKPFQNLREWCVEHR